MESSFDGVFGCAVGQLVCKKTPFAENMARGSKVGLYVCLSIERAATEALRDNRMCRGTSRITG